MELDIVNFIPNAPVLDRREFFVTSGSREAFNKESSEDAWNKLIAWFKRNRAF